MTTHTFGTVAVEENDDGSFCLVVGSYRWTIRDYAHAIDLENAATHIRTLVGRRSQIERRLR